MLPLLLLSRTKTNPWNRYYAITPKRGNEKWPNDIATPAKPYPPIWNPDKTPHRRTVGDVLPDEITNTRAMPVEGGGITITDNLPTIDIGIMHWVELRRGIFHRG
jgi:hypothetical protein